MYESGGAKAHLVHPAPYSLQPTPYTLHRLGSRVEDLESRVYGQGVGFKVYESGGARARFGFWVSGLGLRGDAGSEVGSGFGVEGRGFEVYSSGGARARRGPPRWSSASRPARPASCRPPPASRSASVSGVGVKGLGFSF